MERGLDFDVMLLIGSVVFDNLRCFWRESEEFLPFFRRPIAWAIFSPPLRLIQRREGFLIKISSPGAVSAPPRGLFSKIFLKFCR